MGIRFRSYGLYTLGVIWIVGGLGLKLELGLG